MYIFNMVQNFNAYLTSFDASNRVIALRKYLSLFKKEFLGNSHDKSISNIYVQNDILHICIPNNPEFTISMIHVGHLDDTSFEPTRLIGLGEHIDCIKDMLMNSYKYDYAFITATGRYITGDCRSATRMSYAEIAKQVFNTENAHLDYSQCNNQKLVGYIQYNDGHTEDFNGIYKEEKIS